MHFSIVACSWAKRAAFGPRSSIRCSLCRTTVADEVEEWPEYVLESKLNASKSSEAALGKLLESNRKSQHSFWTINVRIDMVEQIDGDASANRWTYY